MRLQIAPVVFPVRSAMIFANFWMVSVVVSEGDPSASNASGVNDQPNLEAIPLGVRTSAFGTAASFCARALRFLLSASLATLRAAEMARFLREVEKGETRGVFPTFLINFVQTVYGAIHTVHSTIPQRHVPKPIPNFEVKARRAWLVLRRGTTGESHVPCVEATIYLVALHLKLPCAYPCGLDGLSPVHRDLTKLTF